MMREAAIRIEWINRFTCAAIVAAVLLLFSGCDGTVVTTQVLSAPFVVEADQRLVGIWRSSDQELGEVDGLLHIETRNDGKFDAVSVSHNPTKGLTIERAEFTSAKLGSDQFLSLRHLTKNPKESVSAGGYLFLKYAVSGDTLEFWRLSPKFLEGAIKKKQLRGRVVKDKGSISVRITDSFKNLDAFLRTADQAQAYEKLNTLTRVSGKSPIQDQPQ